MAKDGNIAYISMDFGHKNSDRNGNIILKGSENGSCQFKCHENQKS